MERASPRFPDNIRDNSDIEGAITSDLARIEAEKEQAAATSARQNARKLRTSKVEMEEPRQANWDQQMAAQSWISGLESLHGVDTPNGTARLSAEGPSGRVGGEGRRRNWMTPEMMMVSSSDDEDIFGEDSGGDGLQDRIDA